MFGKKKRNGNDPHSDKPGKGKKKADFGIEPLEKRVLMSASWVDTDSGDVQDGPTHEADTFHGSDMADTANGGNGDDILFGNGGNDILSGSHGNDQLYGGDGNDTLDGGTGEDQLFGGSGDDVLRGGDQQDHLVGGDGNDTLDGGTDNDNLIGGSGHDNLIGGHGDDYLDGGSGNDTLDGGTGHDTIIGGDGNDTITGDHGDDVITGGKGNDTIDAGTGNDVISYTVGDGSDVVIGDWGTDRIEINGDASSASHVLVEDGATYSSRTGDSVASDRVVVSVNGVKSIEAHGIEQIQFNSAHAGDTIETSGNFGSTGLNEASVSLVDPPEPENTAPSDLNFFGGSVTENAEAGTLVAVASVVDADSDDVHAFELVDDAGGRFEIDSATGEITVADGAQLNHEAAGTHSVTVRVTDSDGAEYEESLSIGITDANEAPTDLVFSSGNPDFVLSGEQVAEALPEGATATEYTVSGVPEGASLSAGSQNDDGTWTVSADQVDGLRVVNADPTSAIGLTLSTDVVGSESVTTTITASNVRDTDAGFTVTARSITNDGQLTEASADNVVTSGGSFAVNGSTGGPSSQIGYDASKGISEELVVAFDAPITSVQANISKLYTDEAGSCEQGEWVAYRDGVEVASSIFIATQNNAATLDIDAGGEEFDQVVFRATEYTGGQNGKTSDSSDYMVDSITFDRKVPTVTHYDIPVTIEAEWGEADSATVVENASAGTVVATMSVSDPDAGDSHSFELVGNADGRFEIDAATGAISVAEGAELDHESADAHELTVRVTDANGETYDEVLSISVTDSNEAPTDLGLSNSTVAENAEAGTVVGSISVTDQDVGDTHTFELTDDAGGRFEVDSDGNIVVAEGAELDYEAASEHEVSVRVTDSEGSTYEQVVSIEVADVNEAPTELRFTGGIVSENAAGGTFVASASVSDPDVNDSHTYELPDDAGGRFVIDQDGNITVADGADLNYESETSHQITVKVTDENGETIEDVLEVSVANVMETLVVSGNETLTAADGPFEHVVINGGYIEIDGDAVIEGDLTITSAARINGGEISVTGNVTTTDTNYHGSATIVLSGDGAQSISTGDGAGELHNVSITNTSGQVAIEGDLQISGNYTDNGNTVDATGATVELQGNASVSGAGTSFGDVTFDGGYFEISEMHVDGDLTLESAARINGGEISVTGNVTTTDTNYHGSATIVLSGDGAQSISTGDGAGELHNVSIANTSGQVTIEGQLEISGSYTDNGNAVDATGATVELQGNASVSGAGTSFGDLVINGGYMELDGDIYINGDVTVENLARLNGGVIYVAGEIIDNDGNWHGTGDIRPWITNEAPSDLTFEGGSVNENAAAGTVVATAAVIDADVEDSHSYELVSDADGRFKIDAQTGVIMVADGAEIDHESASAHEVTVRVTDSHGETYEEALNIAVADVNEAPTAIMLDAEVADTNVLKVTIGGQRGGSGGSTGAPNYQIVVDGQVVKSGTADWMDMTRFSEQDSADRWHELSIELPGDTSPDQVEVRFTNDSWGGSSETDRNLYVDSIQVNGQTFEAEADETQYNRGNNSIGGQEGMHWNGSLQFNTSDAPDPLHAFVSENAAGAVIGQLGVIDPDANDEAGYAVSDARFEVTSEGVLKLRDGVTLDHEAGSVVEVEVIGTDSAGNEIDATFRIGVADVNDTPDAIAFTGGSVSENAEAGTLVASVSVMDQDAGDTHTYELINNAGGRFTIDTEGNITVADGADLDHESAAAHEVTVKATDSAGNTIERGLTIEVSDVNEAPDALASTGGIVQENALVGTVVATVSVSDVDASDTHTYELIDNADGRFVIDGSGNIVLAEGGSLDHESASSHQVTVRVTDSGGNSIEQSIDIDVSDVNENQESMTFTGGNVTENAPAGTVVASANVLDPDAGDTQSYVLTNDAGGRFTIDAGGNIAVAEGAELDHESAASHEVTVKATDSAGNTFERGLTIEIADVNEAMESLTFSGGTIAEDAQAGTIVASASVTDPDAGESFSYELTDDADGRFTIDADGNVVVSTDGALDFESAKSHEVTVRVTDSAGHTIERTLTIEITNINEPTSEEADSGVDVQEQQATSAEPVQFEMQSDSAADGSTQADRSEFEPANYAAQTGEAFEMQAAADTLKWVASEVDEINELAKSVDAAEIHFSDSTASGGQASFEEVFARSNGPNEIDEPTGKAEETPEYERASDGFIGKFWTMLRAGFGTTNRADESQAAGVQNDKALRNRSRQK